MKNLKDFIYESDVNEVKAKKPVKKELSADSFKNDFDSIMSVILSMVDRVEVTNGEKVEKTYKPSEWQKAIHSVGDNYYGNDDLLELIMKQDSGLGTIQLRKIKSNGNSSSYNRQPIGHVIVEIIKNNHEYEFDMTKEAERASLAKFINDAAKKK